MNDLLNPNVEEFLSHYGVKGQHWGVRKQRPHGPGRPTGRLTVTRRTFGQRAAVIGGGVAVGLAANFLTRRLKLPIRALATGAGVIAGQRAVNHFVKNKGKKQVFEIRQAR
jgi:hypothetical protein